MNTICSTSLPLTSTTESQPIAARSLLKTAIVLLGGAAAFHLAFALPLLSPLILVYFACLIELTINTSKRTAFYSGLVLGLLIFIPKLGFFYTLFNLAAFPLWLILALWHALFLFTGHWVRTNLKPTHALLVLPVLWAGFEYFRSELYFLKFSWLAAGYVFAQKPNILLSILGVYGTGFLLMLTAALLSLFQGRRCLIATITAAFMVAAITQIPPHSKSISTAAVNIAGIQLEFPVALEVPAKLDVLLKKHPETDLLVLSEYTFDGPIPPRVRKWCQQNHKYLIAGGKDPAGTNYYNTAFVIDPNGEIIFKQVKAVPIQFFADGLPAPEQKVWNSPWGKIGIGVCYDLSYTRVVDNLIDKGAQLLIFPTMDVAEWGRNQHELHALIAPTRAAEYGVPIFRLASSGISQAITAQGKTIATAPFPGDNAILAATVHPATKPTFPLDRYFALLCSITSLITLVLVFGKPNRRVIAH
jgi:apolipoprotein N-acyltransferase